MSEQMIQAMALGLTIKCGPRLSEKQTADALGVSVDHLRQRVRKKKIIPEHDGKRVFYTVPEIIRYCMESHE